MPTIPVDPRCITPDWLSEVLEADVRACKLEQIGIGVGLLGRLYRVHLEGGPGTPATVVVKLPTADMSARTAICEPGNFYLREIRFYQEIGLANPLPPARPYFAAFDEVTHDFVLVLEDLGRLRNADQTVGCSVADAETLIDAIAGHHAYWWDNDRLASLTWLTPMNVPPLSDVIITNFKAAWPVFLERIGSDMSPAMRDFGERFPSAMQWFLDEFVRPPATYVHGDLRLDQLFFPIGPDDPPLTALDWQIGAKGRGAYDIGYFLSQSLTAETRRRCESELLERYTERLAEHGIVYPREQLRHDYRLAIAWCFAYPVLGAGSLDIANDRQLELLRTMLSGATAAIEDHDALSLRPD
ncbi:oxidoreductase family protein [Mycolicibacterium sp. ND9-15]|uniref:oxidoreductase family protein n=1 Tax=Mycolicibacterium sp. ND9-15 TaxID=3042320 RepID=UPI002DDA80D0|nr:oxidoreductase family protein [Mycolicibacterium sp. ND9-15]WSE56726.1 oxidoreductase family protein [Mycolicibacterium sp. ND9-15]